MKSKQLLDLISKFNSMETFDFYGELVYIRSHNIDLMDPELQIGQIQTDYHSLKHEFILSNGSTIYLKEYLK